VGRSRAKQGEAGRSRAKQGEAHHAMSSRRTAVLAVAFVATFVSIVAGESIGVTIVAPADVTKEGGLKFRANLDVLCKFTVVSEIDFPDFPETT